MYIVYILTKDFFKYLIYYRLLAQLLTIIQVKFKLPPIRTIKYMLYMNV